MEKYGSGFGSGAPDSFGGPHRNPPLHGTQAFPGMTDFIREFQDVLGLKSSHIIGATMGGWTGGLFAYESPNRCDKVILTGNPGFHGAANARLGQGSAPDAEAGQKHLDHIIKS